MRITPVNNNNYKNSFKGSITISRINKDPNSVEIIKAINKAVEELAPKAKEYGCELFTGMYVNPITMAKKIIICTGSNEDYMKRFGENRADEKVENIDSALLDKIKDIKASLKTERVPGACLIDYSFYGDSGLIKKTGENVITAGVGPSERSHWYNYKFERQANGDYLALYKKTAWRGKEGVIFDF